MAETATIYDCEYLTTDTAMSTFWCAPDDPDPLPIQIGAVRVSLTSGLPIEDKTCIYIQAKDRQGKPCKLHPFVTELTGITQRDIDEKGVPLATALQQFEEFSQGGTIWSWGLDDRHLMALACFVEGIPPNIPATRFKNAAIIAQRAGMPLEDILKTNSGKLASYFKLPQASDIHEHDGLSDALSITYAFQHLERQGRLDAEWLHE